MLDFSGIDNTTGSFPDVAATNASGPTLRDGTPITADFVNDIWGAFQAILSAAGTTPSDSVETASTSDLLDSIRRLCGVPGEIVFHASPSDSISANILPLKGQVVSISAYPALVEATYIGDSNNPDSYYPCFYKCLDTGGLSRSTSGSYFKLPDCRGYFVRALAGASTGVDAYRDENTTLHSVDFRNMAGSRTFYSPGWHIHDIESSSGVGLKEDLQYVMRTSPGTVTGSAGAAPTYPAYMYYKNVGYENLVTQKARLASPLVDFGGSSSYDELYPKNAGFQLGIRY